MGRKVAKHSEETRGVKAKKCKKHKTRSYSTSQSPEAAEQSIEMPPPTQMLPGHEHHPEAASSGGQTTAATTQHNTTPPTFQPEVTDVISALIVQNWDLILSNMTIPAPADINAYLSASSQALHNLNIQVALQRLRDRATAASTHNQQDAARGHALEIRDSTTQHPQPHQLTSFQISKQIALFGRYPDLRPRGLLTDTEDRISLNSLMTTWGVSKGLSTIQIREALQQHAASRKRQRFTITTNHNDTMIAVSKPSPQHNTPRGKWRSSPSSPCRRAR